MNIIIREMDYRDLGNFNQRDCVFAVTSQLCLSGIWEG